MIDEKELRCPVCDAEVGSQGQPFASEWAVACHAAGKIRSRDRLHLGWAQQQLPSVDHTLATQDLATRLLPSIHATLKQLGTGKSVAPAVSREVREAFERRCFHEQVELHAQTFFYGGHYFHAVFEASKAYNKAVRQKAKSDKDGQALMLEVWGSEKGVLRVSGRTVQNDTDRNVQDGIKFLSAGLMQAIRNPAAHEPATDWPIGQDDCLDILSLLSFLFRKLDDTTVARKGKRSNFSSSGRDVTAATARAGGRRST